MNWNRPRADDEDAMAFGLRPDSTWAVARRYWNLVPVAAAASRMAPTTPEPCPCVPVASISMACPGDAQPGWPAFSPLPMINEYGKRAINEAPPTGENLRMTHATAVRHKRGGMYFEDFVVGEIVEHRYSRTV